jgi:hypothetical protein
MPNRLYVYCTAAALRLRLVIDYSRYSAVGADRTNTFRDQYSNMLIFF